MNFSYLNDLFDEVVVINLPESVERLHSVTLLLENAGVRFTVIEAVDGRGLDSIDSEDYSVSGSLGNRFMPSIRKLRGGGRGRLRAFPYQGLQADADERFEFMPCP